MQDQLLKIKTNMPPLRPGMIFRPRLINRLEESLLIPEGFSRKLTLLSAPAGFGKTTLVRQWMAGKANRVAWYALDGDDNDPKKFWAYFITALQSVEKNLGNTIKAMVSSLDLIPENSIDNETIAIELLNQLVDVKEPLFLVLDDYHVIHEEKIHENMAFFIERLPSNLHILVITRSDPPWPLARWRNRGQMAEIRELEVRFSDRETEEYFAIHAAQKLNKSELKAINKRAEGWVTALQSAALSLPDDNVSEFITHFTGSHRHLAHFINEEVLNNQPPEVQEFLIKTSILDRLYGPLCDAITGITDSQKMLEKMEQDNLFIIPLEYKGEFFRYHNLFADLLRLHLKKKYPELIPALHKKAGLWLEQKGDLPSAIKHALAGQELERVAYLINKDTEELWRQEGLGQLVCWLDQLPIDVLLQYPFLIPYRAIFHIIKDDKDRGAEYFAYAEKIKPADESKQMEFDGLMAVVKAHYAIFTNDLPQIIVNTQKAMELIPHDMIFWRSGAAIAHGDAQAFCGEPEKACASYVEAFTISKRVNNHFSTLLAGLKLSMIYWNQGRLMDAEKICHELITYAQSKGLGSLPRVGSVNALLALIYKEKGDLLKARELVDQAVTISQNEKPILCYSYLCKAMVLNSCREYNQALEAIGEIESIDLDVGLHAMIKQETFVWKGRILLKLEQPVKAKEYYRRIGIYEEAKMAYLQETGYLVLVRILFALGDLEKAKVVLDKLEELTAKGSRKGLQIETLLLEAQLIQGDNLHEAIGYLEAALQLGASEGFFQTFIDEGENLRTLLSRMPSSSPFAGYAQKILDGLTLGCDNQKNKQKDQMPEKLSSREMEILELIGQGLSNQAIADQLFLSLGTVKWHTSNIYGKLNVENRTEAAAKARELNL